MRPVRLSGIGVHGGVEVCATLSPAPPGTGIVFVRTDLDRLPPAARRIPARYACAADLRRSTTIANRQGARAATIEHLMAALSGCGVDNAEISLDGEEVPVLDGSAAPFCTAIRKAGLQTARAARRFLRICRPVRVQDGDRRAELLPGEDFDLDVAIDFADPAIGRQRFAARISPAVFVRELAPARTFGFADDLEHLRKAGLAAGASLDNTIAIRRGRVLNPGGLRFADEYVRHKALDALGDLALAGAPIRGRFRSEKGGHELNNRLLRRLFARPAAFRFESAATKPPAPRAARPAALPSAAAAS